MLTYKHITTVSRLPESVRVLRNTYEARTGDLYIVLVHYKSLPFVVIKGKTRYMNDFMYTYSPGVYVDDLFYIRKDYIDQIEPEDIEAVLKHITNVSYHIAQINKLIAELETWEK